MKSCLLPCLYFFLFTFSLTAQPNFTDQSSRLAYQNTYSGAPIGCADMNGDGLDDIVHFYRPTSMVRIQYQQLDGTFTGREIPGSSANPWSLVLGDVNQDGLNDILIGPYSRPEILVSDGTIGGYVKTALSNFIFSQGANFVDIDTDGDLDIFVCDDNDLSTPYANDGNGNFTYDLSLIAAYSNGSSDNSGNYASIWTDYDNDGDLDMYLSRCRGGVSYPMDPRRINQLFQNDGDNNFTDVAEAAGLMPLAQSWSTDFGDLDNDGDLDCVILNHDQTSRIYEQTSPGVFTDRTISTDLAINPFTPGIQVIIEDFDNDGLQDIVLSGVNGDLFMQNTGNFTFSFHHNLIANGPEPVHTAAVGDLNDDGLLDLIAGRGFGYNSNSTEHPDVLLLNQNPATNHFLKVRLEGTTSNLNGIGSRIEIYGGWGIQVREVRAGESYGISHSLTKHFGLGAVTEIDSVVVRWPLGRTQTYRGITVDGTVVLTEATVEQEVVTTNVTANFCTDEVYTINNLTFSEPGNYVIDTLENTPETLNLLVLDLIENPAFASSLFVTSCSGENYTALDGTIFPAVSADFMHVNFYQTVNGCDSLITENVRVLPTYFTELPAVERCSGEVFTALDGTIFMVGTSGLSHQNSYQTTAGCDSVIVETVIARPVYEITLNPIFSCPGEDFTAADGTVFPNIQSSFTHQSNLISSSGCDSIVNESLDLYENFATSEVQTSCSGENYIALDGTIFPAVSADFTHVNSYQTVNGCDSLITENVRVLPTYTTIFMDTICLGANYIAADGTSFENVLSPFEYTSTLVSTSGCDSFVVTRVELYYVPIVDFEPIRVCPYTTIQLPNGEPFEVGAESVVAQFIATSINGCSNPAAISILIWTVETADSLFSFENNVVTYSGLGEVQHWLNCESGDVPIGGQTGNSIELTESGFIAAVIEQNNCVVTSACLAFVLSNTSEPEWANDLKIFPNPTKGQVTISLPSSTTETFKVEVLDLLGRNYGSFQLDGMGGNEQLELPAQAGIYLLRISDNQERYSVRRVVVE